MTMSSIAHSLIMFGAVVVSVKSMIVGGRSGIPLDGDIMVLADLAVNTHVNGALNDNDYLMVVEDIQNIQSQVVSGRMLYFDVVVRESICTKNQVELIHEVNVSTCPPKVHDSAPRYLCHLRVWQKPWLHFQQTFMDGEQCEQLEPDNGAVVTSSA